jgi:hypothetical protein
MVETMVAGWAERLAGKKDAAKVERLADNSVVPTAAQTAEALVGYLVVYLVDLLVLLLIKRSI